MGQTWTGTACSGTAGTYTWASASALNVTFAGKSDWRLPSIAELQTIVERSAYSPAINTAIFPNTPSADFWSASPESGFSSYAWTSSFSYSGSIGNAKSGTYRVRLVRGAAFDPLGLYTPNAEFIDNGNGTVTHKKTGLMWKRCAVGQLWTGTTCSGTATSYSWLTASTLTSTTGGYTDWHLPTQSELLSIVEYLASYPAVNTGIFPNTPTTYFWSKTADPLLTDWAAYVDFYDGFELASTKTDANKARLVRTAQIFGSWGFADLSNVALNSPFNSNALSVVGIASGTTISISGGTYSVNGGTYTADPGTLSPNDTVTVQLNSSSMPSTAARATLNIGGVSGDFIVTTKADTQAPSVPADVKATLSGTNQVQLIWSAATDNVGVTAYRIYRDDVLLTTLSNVTQYTDASAGAGAGSAYRVAACDAAKNCSGSSAPASAGTQTGGKLLGEYLDYGDGTVRHRKTGLTWMRCAMGQTWTGTACSGTAGTYTWASASALSALNVTFAGKSDWRLPSIAELQTIADRKVYDPAIDTTVFPNTPSSYFWSASSVSISSTYAWKESFSYGGSSSDAKTAGLPLRLVRGASFDPLALYTPNADFIDNGNGTVTHKKTGLMWKRCAEGQIWSGALCGGAAADYTWEQANSLSSSTAGYGDWRLPTQQELLTIVEYKASYPAINTSVFANAASGYYWSNLADSLIADWAGIVSFYDGYSTTVTKSNVYPARLVRTAQVFGPWGFADQDSVPANSTVTSNTLAVVGVGNAMAISVSGGSYSVNGSAYTTDPGSVSPNDRVTVQLNSSPIAAASVHATLTVGGVTGDFFAATAIPDSQAPSVPTNLALTAAGDNQLKLVWSAASDNVGVTSYRMYRDDVLLTTLGKVTQYQDSGLAAKTKYSYRILACDVAGNCSAMSAAASGTTQSGSAVTAATPMRDFADNGDGTVTHRVTGLTWMRCLVGQTWMGSICSGTANTYTWVAAAALKPSFAGKSDWRLPSIAELLSIIEWETDDMFINSAIFPSDAGNYWLPWFWSASPYFSDANQAWASYLRSSPASESTKTGSNSALLVRGGAPFNIAAPYTSSTDFIDNADGTVTHKKTGLMWKRCAEGQNWSGSTCTGSAAGYDWYQATNLISSAAGYSDWHLPTMAELVTIVEYQASKPAINTAIFPNTAQYAGFWSASTYTSIPGNAWQIWFSDGFVYHSDKTWGYNNVRLVRPGQIFGPWSFTAQKGVALNSTVTSNTLMLSAIDAATDISVAGGTYSVNGGAYTVAVGKVSAGDKVTLRLTSSPSYDITARATLTIGNVSADFTVTTLTETLPPTTPAGLSATANGIGQIDLAWSAASDDIGVAGYRIYRNGVLVATVGNVTRYSDTQLADATSFSYSVVACDSAENCSPGSNAVSTSTGGELKTAPMLAAGAFHSVAIDAAGSLWSWGYNDAGQLGDGNTGGERSRPHAVGTGYALAAAGSSHTLALTADGGLWSWGGNDSGQLGDGGTSARNLPQQLGAGFAAIAAGEAHSLAVKNDGALWAWGKNSDGQVGDGTNSPHAAPVQIGSGYYAVAAGIQHSLALKTDGTIWAWGSNDYGQLGDGSGSDRYAPTLIDQGYGAIAAGAYHSLALKTDGSLWTWGRNNAGQLGNGSRTHGWSPSLIGSGFVAIAAGAAHSIAIKTDGSLWAWGLNTNGQLGDGKRIDSLVPTRIASGISAVAAGDNHALALKPDGTIWAWGMNGAGQLGDGTFANRSTRVSVVNETVDGILDLVPDVAYRPPKYDLPPYFSIAAKGSTSIDDKVTVTNTAKINSEDLGRTGAVYVTAMVPAGALGVASVAGAQAQGAGRSTARNGTAAASSPQCVQLQLTASGWQPYVGGEIIAHATGVLGEFQAAQTLMQNVDLKTLPGAKFCVGYGASASEMIASKRWKTVVSISGEASDACTAAESCMLDSNVQPINYSVRLSSGWNLLGNSLDNPLAVAVAFGEASAVTSVWKWDAANARWLFYAPSLDAASLRSYAASKGYGVLAEIMPGEGYWVNAPTQFLLPDQLGNGFNLVWGDLEKGWNLVASGRDLSPSSLNVAFKASLSGADVTTLWAWDNVRSNWYFYAPSLEVQGGTALSGYIASKSYLDFNANNKTLGNGTGFWVNRP